MPKSTQKRQPIKGRPRKDGAPPIQKAQRAIILAESKAAEPANLPTTTATATFKVEECDSIRESVEVNGLALMQDAYARAARLETPFDQAVYLTLLGKAHPMAQLNTKDKVTGTAKKRLKALESFLAGGMGVQDAEYKTITGPIGPPSGVAQAQDQGQADD